MASPDTKYLIMSLLYAKSQERKQGNLPLRVTKLSFGQRVACGQIWSLVKTNECKFSIAIAIALKIKVFRQCCSATHVVKIGTF